MQNGKAVVILVKKPITPAIIPTNRYVKRFSFKNFIKQNRYPKHQNNAQDSIIAVLDQKILKGSIMYRKQQILTVFALRDK